MRRVIRADLWPVFSPRTLSIRRGGLLNGGIRKISSPMKNQSHLLGKDAALEEVASITQDITALWKLR
jgi:hypothetical protein